MGIFNSDVKEIKIVWDRNIGRSYFPGEEVSGKAVLITEKDDVKIQKATITFTGELSIFFIDVSISIRLLLVDSVLYKLFNKHTSIIRYQILNVGSS